MNQLDSELVASGLVRAGFLPVSDQLSADIILFNTCSIRQHAEDKIYSALGRLKNWKQTKPLSVIGVIGCMAQKDQTAIINRAPHVDLVLGPGQLDILAETVNKLLNAKSKGITTQPEVLVSLLRLKDDHAAVTESFRLYDPIRNVDIRKKPFQATVRVMFGCNKFCTYCIVPRVRGPEQSRHPREIIDEVKQLVDQGAKEITFIGQTVNSYKYTPKKQTTTPPATESDKSNPDRENNYNDRQNFHGVVEVDWADKVVRLSDLLYLSSEVTGLERIRFVTNYPTNMDNDLLEAVRDLPKVAKYLHVPAQSGSDNVLKRMQRRYTVAGYWELLFRIREMIPRVSVTSDFIVGFCGETEAEFLETARLVREGKFKNSFIFKYSERPGTKSAELYKDDIPESVKKQRNNDLLKIQDEISLQLNRQFIGQNVEILVENISKKYDNGKLQLSGRTNCDRIVVFDADNTDPIGQFIEINIQNAAPFTLFGQNTITYSRR